MACSGFAICHWLSAILVAHAGNVVLLLQRSKERYDPGHAFFHRELGGQQFDFGFHRHLIWRAHASEVADLPGAGLRVEPLGVALFAGFDGDVQINLDELTWRQALANRVAVGAIRGDEGRYAYHSRIREQLGHFPYPPDILAAILRRETQIGAQAVADVVAIKDVNQLPPRE